MKKVILTALFAISILFSSCKESTKREVNKEATEIGNEVEKGLNNLGDNIKEGYNEVKESVKSTLSDIEIPNLNDEKAETHLESYANYVKNQMDKGVENISNSEFVKETKAFGEKSEEFLENLGAEAKASFKATKAKIDLKVETIEKDLEK